VGYSGIIRGGGNRSARGLTFLEKTNTFRKVTRRLEEERERFARRRGLAAWMIGEDGREVLEKKER
jgi:hypothetical protein